MKKLFYFLILMSATANAAPSSVQLECFPDARDPHLSNGNVQYECIPPTFGRGKGEFSVDFRFGADVSNALFGSAPTGNHPEMDFYVALPMTFDVLNIPNIQITPSYENFSRIGYRRVALEIGKEFHIRRFSYTFGLEGGVITRDGEGSFVNYGINNTVQYNISKRLAVGLVVQTQNRTDLNQIYGYVNGHPQIRVSNFLFLKVNLNKKQRRR